MTERYDEGAMEGKREELLQITLEAISAIAAGQEAIAGILIDRAVELTPPECADEGFQLITVRGGGRRGGATRKPGNLILSWTAVLNLAADIALTDIAASGAPWLLPFIAIHLWNTVVGGTTREVSPQHAMALLAMWENRDGENAIEEQKAFLFASERVVSGGYSSLTQQEFAEIVDDLCALRCIELVGGVIHLKERVHSQYC